MARRCGHLGEGGGLYLGRTFPFKVIEYENNGRNVIVSRRVILDAERKERLVKLKESLSVGMDVEATVRSVQNFGAFVDLGGVEGLIPASELSWDRSARPQDMLTAGGHFWNGGMFLFRSGRPNAVRK